MQVLHAVALPPVVLLLALEHGPAFVTQACVGVGLAVSSSLAAFALTPFPVVATILASFTHRLYGAEAATGLLLGLLKGLFSFAVFFLVIGWTVASLGVGAAFLLATVCAMATHGSLLYVSRRRLPTVDHEVRRP